jgi:hypothetical protein
MTKGHQTNTRLPPLTLKQLEEINDKEGLNFTQAQVMAIDHFYQELQKKWKSQENSAKTAESLPILESK